MKKLILTALLGASALAIMPAAAMAEGKAAIRSETQLNSDSSSPSSSDNSVAHGEINVNDRTDSISATSSTGTKAGTASGTIDAEGNAAGQVGYKDGDDDAARARASAHADADADDNKSASEAASERAQVNEDMATKTGVMKTRAKGAMGMLSADEITTVQQNLISAGYNVQADGVLGSNTKEALKQYQKSKNLNVTGNVDADTRASMGLDN